MKRLTQRLLGATVVLLALVMVAGGTVSAAPNQSVSGSFAGATSSVSHFCLISQVTVGGSMSSSFIGSGQISGSIATTACAPASPGCCGVPGPSYPITGAFTFSGPGGSFEATGVGVGVTSGSPHTDDYQFDLDLTLESGTGRYRQAGGSLRLSVFVTDILGDASPSTAWNGALSGWITPGHPD